MSTQPNPDLQEDVSEKPNAQSAEHTDLELAGESLSRQRWTETLSPIDAFQAARQAVCTIFSSPPAIAVSLTMDDIAQAFTNPDVVAYLNLAQPSGGAVGFKVRGVEFVVHVDESKGVNVYSGDRIATVPVPIKKIV